METMAQLRRKHGLCAVCGEKSETYRCKKCNEIKNKNKKILKALRRKLGLCPECGGERQDKAYIYCEWCRGKERLRSPKKKKYLYGIKRITETMEHVLNDMGYSKDDIDAVIKRVTLNISDAECKKRE